MLTQRAESAADRSRSRSPGAGIVAPARRSVAPYAAFAEVYNFLIEAPAVPLLRAAFRRSVRRFHLNFRSLADLGCGTGGFLATLPCQRISLTGVDRSAAMLEIARRRLAPCAVTLLQQDFRRLDLPNPVDLITCHNQTINYLTLTQDLARTFSAIARNLRHGGALVFDFMARARRDPRLRAARVRETIRLPDHDVHFRGVIDLVRGTSTVRIDIAARRAPNQHRVEVHRQRWFSTALIRRCLRASGLQLLSMRPLDRSNGHWLHVVARRT
jgi:SAM-dependent methyltransferase